MMKKLKKHARGNRVSEAAPTTVAPVTTPLTTVTCIWCGRRTVQSEGRRLDVGVPAQLLLN
jgi:hypothetical protein